MSTLTLWYLLKQPFHVFPDLPENLEKTVFALGLNGMPWKLKYKLYDE